MKKIGLLALVLVLAFGALGFGYAHWSQTLYIDTTVETGELCWGFEEASFMAKDGPTPPPPYAGAASEVADWTCPVGMGLPVHTTKNVGWTTCSLTGEKGEHIVGESVFKLYGTANITLHNVYPCYYNEISLVVANGGTIPIIFEKVKVNGVEVGENELVILPFAEILWKNSIGKQIDPCEGPELSFKVHILEKGDHAGDTYPDGVPGAEQGKTYSFIIELVGTQWNLVD